MWIHTACLALLPGLGILRKAAHVSQQISAEQLRRAMGSTEIGTPPLGLLGKHASAWMAWSNSKQWSNHVSLCLTGWKGGRYLQGDPDDATRPEVPAGIDRQCGSQPQRPPR